MREWEEQILSHIKNMLFYLVFLNVNIYIFNTTIVMIDDKKVKEAAMQHSRWLSSNHEEPTASDSFMEGARWAINEFLKDLWHQTNKEPEGYDEWTLLHYSVGNYYSLAQVKEFKSWKGFVENMPIDGWLYIDDLFSKEGGECK